MPPALTLSDKDLDQLLAADQHLAAALELAEAFFEDYELDPVRRVASDLAIRIVESRYRPESVAQIRALRPSLQRAGLGCLLDRSRAPIRSRDLAGNTRLPFTRQVEAWINFLWDETDLNPLLDSKIESTADLVAWLRRKAGAYRGLAQVFDGANEEDDE